LKNLSIEALKGMNDFFLRHSASAPTILHDVLDSLLPLILDEVREIGERRNKLDEEILDEII
jgi:hypothetical protein